MSKPNVSRDLRSCLAAAAIAGLVAAYLCILTVASDISVMVLMNICSVVVSFCLAEKYQRQEKIDWWALPLGWILGLIPIYVYIYHIVGGGFFGQDFTMKIMSVLLLPVPFCASLIISAIYVEKTKKKTGEKKPKPKNL